MVTGGYNNYSRGIQSMILGGEENSAFGNSSAIPGGILNKALGTASIAMGQQARVLQDHSLVINLQGNRRPVESTAPGQFLVQAKVYTFQVTNDPGPENENVFCLTADNIKLLQAAIDTPPERTHRILHPEQVLRREEEERHRARRSRKVQALRAQHGLN